MSMAFEKDHMDYQNMDLNLVIFASSALEIESKSENGGNCTGTLNIFQKFFHKSISLAKKIINDEIIRGKINKVSLLKFIFTFYQLDIYFLLNKV